MKTFRYNAARGSIQLLSGSGVAEAQYSGPLTGAAFDALRGDLIQSAGSTSGFVIRMDRALILTNDLALSPDAYPKDSPPGAMIVRPDQYDLVESYARKAAKFGIMRAVFFESQASLAYQWVLRQSDVSQQALRQ